MTPSDGNVDRGPAGAIHNSSVNLGEAIAEEEEEEEHEEEKGDMPGASVAAADVVDPAAPDDVLMKGVDAEPVQPLVNAEPDTEDKEKQEEPGADAAALTGDVHGTDGSSQSALPAEAAPAASSEDALASASADGKQAEQHEMAADAGTEAKPKKAAKAAAGASAKRRRTE